MSYPQQEGYGQFGQGFYDSGLTMEAEEEGGAPEAPAPNWQQGYDYNPSQQQQAQWMAGEQEYQGYSSGQAGGYAQHGTGYMDPPAAAGLTHEGIVEGMDTEPVPGSLGHMDAPQPYSQENRGTGFEDEPPLLEELGINFDLIKEKTLSVLNPLQQTRTEIMNDTDLAGPLMYCLLFGLVLMLSGKVHFDYIYGVGLMGCSAMYVVLSLMSSVGVSVSCVVSVLGYCLLPMVLLSCFSIIVSLQGVIGSVLSLVVIVWCSYSASKLFVSVLSMDHQQLLVAYPCALLYGVFALLTVF